MAVIDLRQIPKNAGVGWSQAADFWRAPSSICPGSLIISKNAVATTDLMAVQVPWSYDWISASGVALGTGCDNLTNACTGGAAPSKCLTWHSGGRKIGVVIDIWGALAAGLWSSSAVIYARLAAPSGGVKVQAWASYPCATLLTNPAQQEVTPSAYTSANICTDASAPLVTLTVYDDGTFTLA